MIINYLLKVTLWNVRGLGDSFRGRTVCQWISHFHRDLDVIALQELKANKYNIDFQFSTLFLGNNFIVDYVEEGCARATMIVLSNLIVLDQGTKGDGCLAWCIVDTSVGPVSIGSVYVPN